MAREGRREGPREGGRWARADWVIEEEEVRESEGREEGGVAKTLVGRRAAVARRGVSGAGAALGGWMSTEVREEVEEDRSSACEGVRE